MTHPLVWVTGGSSGLGLATAKLLTARGWRVVVSGRDAQRLEQACAAIGGGARGIAVDVADAAAMQGTAALMLADHGPIAALVANAGGNLAARAWGEVSAEGFESVIDANLNGVFHSINAVLPGMRAAGGGAIVAVSSFAGWYVTAPPGPAYTASKMAVNGLIASLNAAEFRHGIRATALCPGEAATPAMARRVPQPTPGALARMLQADDIAATIAFILERPPHVTINELVITPTWNGAYHRVPGPAPQD